jgi:hypothetical protein
MTRITQIKKFRFESLGAFVVPPFTPPRVGRDKGSGGGCCIIEEQQHQVALNRVT